MVEIVWTEIAVQDLKEIFDFIAEDSKKYATLTVDKLYSKAQEIRVYPHSGRVVPEQSSNDIREMIHRNYRIIYRIVDDKTAHILRVYHVARLMKDDSYSGGSV